MEHNRRRKDIRPTIQTAAAVLAITGGLFAWFQSSVIADTAKETAVEIVTIHDKEAAAHYTKHTALKDKDTEHALALVQITADITATAEAVTRIEEKLDSNLGTILTVLQSLPSSSQR